jgi:hypothetical protein
LGRLGFCLCCLVSRLALDKLRLRGLGFLSFLSRLALDAQRLRRLCCVLLPLVGAPTLDGGSGRLQLLFFCRCLGSLTLEQEGLGALRFFQLLLFSGLTLQEEGLRQLGLVLLGLVGGLALEELRLRWRRLFFLLFF